MYSKMCYRRALGIIENEFVETLMVEQDALGTSEKVTSLVENMPHELTIDLLRNLMDLPTSLGRWNYVVSHVKRYQEVSWQDKDLVATV